jgi:hypothetical protein
MEEKQELDVMISESQSYVLTSDKTNPFQLISFRLSGNVNGGGQVEITLESAAGQELLVYSNVKERSRGLEPITGMVAGEQQEQGISENGDWLVLLKEGNIKENFDDVSGEEEILSGNFGNECVETCLLEMEMSKENLYRLNFELEPGTTLQIREIIYNIQESE